MKKTKIILSVILTAVMLGSLINCFASSGEQLAYVTVFDGNSLTAVREPVAYADKDEDGKWTINDLLISVHEQKCEGGFATATGDYGLYITKLWGVENGGAYGYYLNNAMAMGLTDEVKSGDSLYAYVYSDAASYSDLYSFFDKVEISGVNGDEAVLTLSYVGFDENYAPVQTPIGGAVVTFNGTSTSFVTDDDGKVTVTLPKGNAVISAAKDGLTLIPAVCVYTENVPEQTTADTQAEDTATSAAVTDAASETTPSDRGSKSNGTFWFWFWLIVIIVIAAVCFCVIRFTGKNKKK